MQNWIQIKLGIPVVLRSTHILFGIDLEKCNSAINLIILLSKFYIYRIRCQWSTFSFFVLQREIVINWLTLTSEMHFVKFHPEVVSCLLSRGKRKYAPLGMRLLWIYIRNYFVVYHLTSHFLLYLQKLQRIWRWNIGFAIRKIWAFIWYQKIDYFLLSPGDENVIGIRYFKLVKFQKQIASPSRCTLAKATDQHHERVSARVHHHSLTTPSRASSL